MIEAYDRTLLAEVGDRVARRMGLCFPEERMTDLARGLVAAGRELGFERPETYEHWLAKPEFSPSQVAALASHLTVGETYFFRDSASFVALEREILPPLIASRADAGRNLRLWSAGCCTGEEAYSLAITCARALPDLSEWNVSVLATDINQTSLSMGETGLYSKWSFRCAPGLHRERFFSPASGNRSAVDPSIKKIVHFGNLNLAEDAYPSLCNNTNAMDVIFCRNVLMYFSLEQQKMVVERLYRCLVEGGCLLVNPVEASASLFPMFSVEDGGGFAYYRKAPRPIRAGRPAKPAEPKPVVAQAYARPIPSPEPAATVAPITEAAKAATRSLSAAPAPVLKDTNYLEQARDCANQGNLSEALASCRDAIVAEPTSIAARFLYAMICDELSLTEEAIEALGRVLYLDQDFVLAHHALGGLYRRLGRKKDSTRHLELALRLLSAGGVDEVVPESDGMSRGRLAESVRAMIT
ncbi:MAG TPA: CheR family methyltransferase [bacterium]|nr:CheR family methyltransferase [bacterium]